MLCAIPGINDIGLTTNGILLADHAQALYDAGLRRINISLDTLDPERFRQLTRRDGLDKVIAGILAAKKAGFEPIKINAVSIRGITEHEVVPLAHFAREHGLEMRFIEYMPIGAEHWERDKVYFAHEILEQLEQRSRPAGARPRTTIRVPRRWISSTPTAAARVGIIASVSRPFCMSCNRVRLTADGKLRNCLFALDEVDVKTSCCAARPDADIAEIDPPQCPRQVGRARDQHLAVHQAAADDARDRGVMGAK